MARVHLLQPCWPIQLQLLPSSHPPPVPSALAAAQTAVKGDPARSQRCTTTTAKQDYRLSDKDLGVRGGSPGQGWGGKRRDGGLGAAHLNFATLPGFPVEGSCSHHQSKLSVQAAHLSCQMFPVHIRGWSTSLGTTPFSGPPLPPGCELRQPRVSAVLCHYTTCVSAVVHQGAKARPAFRAGSGGNCWRCHHAFTRRLVNERCHSSWPLSGTACWIVWPSHTASE